MYLLAKIGADTAENEPFHSSSGGEFTAGDCTVQLSGRRCHSRPCRSGRARRSLASCRRWHFKEPPGPPETKNPYSLENDFAIFRHSRSTNPPKFMKSARFDIISSLEISSQIKCVKFRNFWNSWNSEKIVSKLFKKRWIWSELFLMALIREKNK